MIAYRLLVSSKTVTSGTSTIVIPVTETNTVTRTIVTVVPIGTSTPGNPGVNPAPEESSVPAPAESGSPVPEESSTPAPEESSTPAPEESSSPAPAESKAPAPTESSTTPVYTGAASVIDQQPLAGFMVAALGAFALL